MMESISSSMGDQPPVRPSVRPPTRLVAEHSDDRGYHGGDGQDEHIDKKIQKNTAVS